MALPTPQYLAKSGTESGTQRAYLQALRTQPEFKEEIALIYHVPNGGARGGDKLSASIAGANLRAIGQQAGVPDIVVPVGRCGYSNLFVEFKKPDGKGELDVVQIDYIKKLTENGNLVVIVDDWETAYEVTIAYLRNDKNHIIACMLPTRFPTRSADQLADFPPYLTNVIDMRGYIDKFNNAKKNQGRRVDF